jgi:hypothetical protein
VRRLDFTGGLQVVGGIAGDSFRQLIDSEASRTFQAFDGFPGTDAGGLATFTSAGLVPGQQYSYQVSAAYNNGLQDRDGDGMPDAGAQFMSPNSVGSGWITAVGIPVVTGINGSPPSGQPVDVSSIDISWQQPPGADTYVIWLSTEPTFKKAVKINAGREVPVDFGGPSVVTRTVNGNNGKLRKGTNLFITVGGYRSGEPKPLPRGAIFSAPVRVVKEDQPPGEPGSAAGGATQKKKKRNGGRAGLRPLRG